MRPSGLSLAPTQATRAATRASLSMNPVWRARTPYSRFRSAVVAFMVAGSQRQSGGGLRRRRRGGNRAQSARPTPAALLARGLKDRGELLLDPVAPGPRLLVRELEQLGDLLDRPALDR